MKTSLTLDETVTRVRSEPWNDMGCERKCGKNRFTRRNRFVSSNRNCACRNAALSVRTLNRVAQRTCSLINTLTTSIPPQHKETWLMRALVLPRTLPHIRATRDVCVFPFSFRVGVLWLVKEAHPHILRLLSVWVGRSHHR